MNDGFTLNRAQFMAALRGIATSISELNAKLETLEQNAASRHQQNIEHSETLQDRQEALSLRIDQLFQYGSEDP